MTTIKDIAKELSLSTATVSRALHDSDSPYVSDGTRSRVLETARIMGYTPNARGRALATGRTHLVSLWINNPNTAYYAMVAGDLCDKSERRGFHPVVRAASAQSSKPLAWQAQDGLADGVMAVDVGEPLGALVPQGRAPFRPIVALGALCLTTVDHVGVDLYTGAVAAMHHLVATRPGRIVGLMYREDDPRTCAYNTVMREAGREPEVVMIPDESRRTNRALAAAYVAEHGCPAAFFCQNDDVAIAAYRGLLDAGLRIPDDVAIVGCDGIEDGEYLDRPLSTITHPVDEMCEMAWQFLLLRMSQPEAPRQEAVLPSKFVIRASSA
jgi:LacI family transcriptional regulator